MATLRNTGTNFATFTPISSTLNGLPNGAGTLAALVCFTNGPNESKDLCGIINSTESLQYHALIAKGFGAGAEVLSDDDGIVGSDESPVWSPPSVAGHWYICAATWAAGTVTERFHHIDQTTPAGWTHANAGAANGGNRAGPGTNSHWHIGNCLNNSGAADIAVVAAWAGVALSDAQCVELITNNKTSDWWNNTAGDPTLLIECNTLTPTDIGAAPSTFSSIGSLTLAGSNPTGWTFDGRGPVTGTSQLTADHGMGMGRW